MEYTGKGRYVQSAGEWLEAASFAYVDASLGRQDARDARIVQRTDYSTALPVHSHICRRPPYD